MMIYTRYINHLRLNDDLYKIYQSSETERFVHDVGKVTHLNPDVVSLHKWRTGFDRITL